jgi:predicted PurR-regulated permease PerM
MGYSDELLCRICPQTAASMNLCTEGDVRRRLHEKKELEREERKSKGTPGSGFVLANMPRALTGGRRSEAGYRLAGILMKWKIRNKYFRWGLTAFVVVAASISFYYLVFQNTNIKAGLYTIGNILMPVVMGLVTAYLLAPMLNHIENHILIPLCNKLKIRQSVRRGRTVRGIGILITAVLFFLLIYGLIVMLLSQIVPSIQGIVSNFNGYVNNFTLWLNEEPLANYPEVKEFVLTSVDKYSNEIKDWMNQMLLTQSSVLLRSLSLSVISVLKVLWNFIIGFIISIYVLASKENFAGQAKKVIYASFEKNTANIIIHNFRFTHDTFIGFIHGKILDSFIIGILCFIGTMFMKTPYAVLVSVVIGFTNIIPFFGPFLGAIPTAILIFLADISHPLTCVYFLLFILFLQQLDGNFIGPRILGNSTGITGFWVIFSITFFGGLLGVFGMIVGVPIFAVMYAAIRSLVNASLRKKKMPEDTQSYIRLGSVEDDGFHDYVPEFKKVAWKELRFRRTAVRHEEARDRENEGGEKEDEAENETNKRNERK